LYVASRSSKLKVVSCRFPKVLFTLLKILSATMALDGSNERMNLAS
jgi:hypothetical protein